MQRVVKECLWTLPYEIDKVDHVVIKVDILLKDDVAEKTAIIGLQCFDSANSEVKASKETKQKIKDVLRTQVKLLDHMLAFENLTL